MLLRLRKAILLCRVAFQFYTSNYFSNIAHTLSYLLKRIIILTLFTLLTVSALPQYLRFSVATDLGVQRSLKKEQQFWAWGHTVNLVFNLTNKDGIYVWFAYYTNGKFSNRLTAAAKSPLTNPQQVSYTNNASMRFKHFSLGWRKYLVGNCEAEKGWNLYASAGFGLLPGRISNSYSVSIDTSLYAVPVREGRANFKRLTADLGLGWEKPIGADFFLYTEARVWIPASDYPSKYLFVNDNAPLTATMNAGIRILF
ncbi:MAG TPA: hypothetical protein VFV31_06765 [Chitinophagaceae bacterium]|nr:hypothetical protein [Chitinophagaceae bacterium]